MRTDLRPYWVKRLYLRYREWYVNYFLRPECASLGAWSTFMKPRYTIISGPNIHIGECFTAVAEPMHRVEIGVWGREEGAGTIRIGRAVLMSPGSRVSASDEIVIGDGVMMANGTYITDSDWHGVYDRTRRDETPTPVHIGDNVWLGDHATVLKGVSIGENSVVAARAVVTRDVPANVIVAGNPARRLGWTCRCGRRLVGSNGEALNADAEGQASCPACSRTYVIDGDRCLARGEDQR